MTDLTHRLGAATAAAFATLGFDTQGAVVRRSDRPDLADFQCNGALAIAKTAGKKPHAIASEIAAAWSATDLVAQLTVAGPGFLNYRVSDAALSARAQQIADDPRSGASLVATPRRVLVDYGGPNVAKPMHVGHLRASIIGESIKRVFRFRGDAVTGDVHLGDWGFQMGLLIVAFEDQLGSLAEGPALDAALAALSMEALNTTYPVAAARAKGDLAYRDRARKATVALQSGAAVPQRIWRTMHDLSTRTLQQDFAALGITFDLWKGESDADPYIPAVIEDLTAKHLLEHDQGAQIVRVARPDDKREVPPLLVTSSEGSAMYGTTDLATIWERERDLDPELYLYVVDQRQADHFVQVFRVAEMAGWVPPGTLEHIGFGTMNGPDGKPFKTREGGVLRLGDLIGMARDKARQRLQEAQIGTDLSPAEYEDVADKVAIAALKFADLVNFRGTSYVFDLDRFMRFEGKTGPYLLYAVVRIKSILRRAATEGVTRRPVAVGHASERALALVLDAFDGVLVTAYERRSPHVIAEHAFALAQSFSGFYENCPIVREPDEAVRGSRLTLATVTLAQLERTLDLLGLAAPERM